MKTLRTKVLLGITLPLLGMLGLGALNLIRIQAMQESNDQVDRSHHIVTQAQAIMKYAVDMEAGMHSYLLAGRDEFLEPYVVGEKATYEHIADLQNTLSDKPEQVAKLEEAANILHNWQIQVAEKTIALRRSIGDAQTMNDLAKIVQQGRGRYYFGQFRSQISEFIKNEQELLTQREQHRAALAEQSSSAESSKEMQEALYWVRHTYQVIGQANALLTHAVDMETGVRGYLLAGRESFLTPYVEGSERFKASIQLLLITVSNDLTQVKLLKSIRNTIKQWQDEVVKPMLELRKKIGDAKTMDDMADVIAQAKGKLYFDQFREVMESFITEEQAVMAQNRALNLKTVQDTQSITLIAFLIVFSAAMGFGVFVVKKVLEQIGGEPAQIMSMAIEIADGRLDSQFDNKATGILGALGVMVSHWRNLVLQAREIAALVDTSSTELSSTTQSLSQGAAEQAASLEQTTASMEELAANTRRNMQNAQLTEETAAKVLGDAKNGQQAVDDAVNALQEITTKISVMSEISKRINLLALNAAIEAARAGQHGQGFAVVASEVRKLAEHSQLAAKDIAQLSVSSTERGENASLLINQTLESFAHTTELVRQISQASREQGEGIEQVNRSLQQLEQITQQYAGAAEEIASTSQELASRSKDLRNNMEFFQI